MRVGLVGFRLWGALFVVAVVAGACSGSGPPVPRTAGEVRDALAGQQFACKEEAGHAAEKLVVCKRSGPKGDDVVSVVSGPADAVAGLGVNAVNADVDIAALVRLALAGNMTPQDLETTIELIRTRAFPKLVGGYWVYSDPIGIWRDAEFPYMKPSPTGCYPYPSGLGSPGAIWCVW